MSKKKSWPTISVSKEDQGIIKEISHSHGVLQNADTKDILMIAAAIAVKMNAPDLEDEAKRKDRVDVIHGSLLSGQDYDEYRQYMLLIFYHTKARGNLNEMDDLSAIALNFVDYAHRGLQIMKDNYLKSDGPDKFEEMFAEAISKRKEPVLK